MLTQFNGDPLPDDDTLRLKVLYAKSPVAWSLAVDDDSARQIDVPLNGDPVRIGFSWRADKADDSLATVTLVRTSSAAELAGVVVGDRIIAVNGETFSGSNDLIDKLVTLPSPIQIRLENKGQIRTVELNPLPSRSNTAESASSE